MISVGSDGEITEKAFLSLTPAHIIALRVVTSDGDIMLQFIFPHRLNTKAYIIPGSGDATLNQNNIFFMHHATQTGEHSLGYDTISAPKPHLFFFNLKLMLYK